jgi:hypothetical protein
MCPLCLTSLAVTVTTTTGVGAAAVAVATRVAKSLARHSADDASAPAPADRAQEVRGDR